MPELPEVETITNELRSNDLIGKKIEDVQIFWDRTIATSVADVFRQQVVNKIIRDITRRGKYIVWTLNKGYLLVHLRMTGKFFLHSTKMPPTSHERVRVNLNDGRSLCYEDQRKFGKWYYVEQVEEKLQKLGLEPLSPEFTLKALQDMLKMRSQKIKPFLLDQQYISGLGNIYVDEALWMAKIHPATSADQLTKKQTLALYEAIPYVLKQGIANMGTTLGSSQANYFSVSGRRGGNQTQLKVFRKEGLLCPRCQTKIIKIVLAQRGTHICPHCQKNRSMRSL